MSEATPTTAPDFPAPPSSRAGDPSRKALRLALGAVAAYAAFDLLLPLLHVPLRGLRAWQALSLLILPTAAFMLLQLWLSRSLVETRPRAVTAVALTALSVAAWFLAQQFVHPWRGLPLATNFWLYSLGQLLQGLTITFAGTFFGILLSRIVREANVLLPVALLAMPIDYIGAMTPIGFTQNAVQQHPSLVHHVSVPMPAVGGLHPIAFIGPGDALFMAFFFAIVLRLGLNLRGTFWTLYGLLTVTMLLVLLTGLPIAALIPMGLAVIAANARAFRLKREEVFAVLYAGALILALVVGFYWYSHHHFFRH